MENDQLRDTRNTRKRIFVSSVVSDWSLEIGVYVRLEFWNFEFPQNL
ncbi:MAG: hypothetical protein ACI9OD_002464 [Limisphaerales bacterium]|jgi:hypothetical protein